MMEWKELLFYFIIILVSVGLFMLCKIKIDLFKNLLREFQSEISNLKYLQKNILDTNEKLGCFNEGLKDLQLEILYLGKDQLDTGYKLVQLDKSLKRSQLEISCLRKGQSNIVYELYQLDKSFKNFQLEILEVNGFQLNTVGKLDQLDKSFKNFQLEILEVNRFQLNTIGKLDVLDKNFKNSHSEIIKIKNLQLHISGRFDQIKLEMKLKKFKTFCPLPWMHLSLDPSGKTRLCCNADYEIRDVPDEAGNSIFIGQMKNANKFFNLPFYKTIRKQMLRNQKPEVCSTCYKLEEHGTLSTRQQFKRHWKNSFSEFLASTKNDGTLTNINIKYLDLPLGNVCNLRCRMCHPNNSIQMKKDFDHLNMNYNNAVNHYGKWIKEPGLYKKLTPFLKTAEEIFFTGGEPLLIKEHENILKKAIELKVAKNIKIKYNSNLTKLSLRLLALWKEFREVEFNCSIDGFGRVNNYIRFPSKWSTMEKALNFLDDLSEKYPHIKIYIHSTFQILNLFNLPDLLKWLGKAKWRNIYRMPHFIWLHEPKFLRASVLPDSLKAQAIDEIEKTLKDMASIFLEYNKDHVYWSKDHLKILSGYLARLKNTSQEKEYFTDFINYTVRMDRFRKQDITQIVPEFKVLFHKTNQKRYKKIV